MANSESKPNVEKEIVNVFLHDRRVDRRWRNIRFFFWVFIFLLYAVLIFGPRGTKFGQTPMTKPYVSLIRLSGIIMPNTYFSSRKVIPVLNKAFKDKKAKGVVIVINSPGGSPVQASIIHDKIMQLKKKYNKKVVVIGQDALASGAYLVATAADKIFVHKDTLTGSIGVIMSGFGFTDAIQKLGISRRVFTAGDHKDRLDPFKPMDPADKAKIHHLLNLVHQNFINDVLETRRDKLRGNQNELFSGDFWTGQQAVKLGLADGTGNLWDVLQQVFKVSHYKKYSSRPSFIQALFKGVESELNLGLTQHSAKLEEIMN